MAFNGFSKFLSNAIELANQSPLRSNEPINALWHGITNALDARIKNSENLKKKFATELKLEGKGNTMKRYDRDIDNFDRVASLFFNQKGNFSYGRGASALAGGGLAIAGGIRLVNG